MLRAESVLQRIPPPVFTNILITVKQCFIMGKPFWQTPGGAAAISGASSFASGLFGGLFAGGAQRRQYKYNKKLQEQQQAWQEKMWNLENMYQLPKNEVQRLLDAGINPALAFGNAGAAAAPIPTSGSAGGVSAPTADFGNPGGAAVQAAMSAQQLENDTKVAESVSDRNEAEAAKFRKEADESGSRKALNDILIEIQGSEEYKAAVASAPGIMNSMRIIERNMSDLQYSYDLETYGTRIESLKWGVKNQKMSYVATEAQVHVLGAEYQKIGAEIRNLDAGTEVDKARAAVLRQDLDIRAGDAFLGTLKRDALKYCQDYGIKDEVTGEVTSFLDALASQYANGVVEGIYSSKEKAVTAHQESIYQSAHGQDRREAETTEIERRGNWYRTSQWNMSIHTAVDVFKEAAGFVMTKGASTLITPKSGSERMPLSPDALDVLRKVSDPVEKRLIY